MTTTSTEANVKLPAQAHPIAEHVGEAGDLPTPTGHAAASDGAPIGGFEPTKAEKRPLIDSKEFAAKLGCRPKHVLRMADSGRCPPPILLGGLRRWNRQAVDDWIAAGCPVIRHPRMGRRK